MYKSILPAPPDTEAYYKNKQYSHINKSTFVLEYNVHCEHQ